MNQEKFGESYFAFRAAYRELLRDIDALGKDLNATQSFLQIPPTTDFFSRDSFQFLICGERGAGKSSLLQVLAGHELCKNQEEASSLRYIHYQFGTRYHDVKSSPYVEQRYRPLEFLKNYHFVEAPGIGVIKKAQEPVLRAYLESSDLLLFVLSITDPWAATSWNFLSSLSSRQISRTILLLQKSDLVSLEDFEMIKSQIQELSLRALGMKIPIFIVSAKLASETRREDFLFSRSGFPDLEAFITKQLFLAPQKRAALEAENQAAYRALRAQEEFIEHRDKRFNEQSHFFQSLEKRIEALCHRLLGKIPEHMENVRGVFEAEALPMNALIERKFGFWRGLVDLFFGHSSMNDLEREFLSRLRFSMDGLLESDSRDIMDLCTQHWAEMIRSHPSQVFLGMGDQAVLSQRLEPSRQEWIRQISHAAKLKIGDFPTHKRLQVALRMRNLSLKSFLVVSLLGFLGGALCGIFTLPWFSFIGCSLGFLFFLGGIRSSSISRKNIARIFQESSSEVCDLFSQSLSMDYDRGMRVFFRDYQACLTDLRADLLDRKVDVEAIQKRWHQLFLRQKSLEQELSF